MHSSLRILLAAISIFSAGCTRVFEYRKALTDTGMSYAYSTEIRTIMQSACTNCHSASLKSGGLALDSYSQNDYLGGDLDARWNRVLDRVLAGTMPPPPNSISAREIEVLTVWIQQGIPENPVVIETEPENAVPVANAGNLAVTGGVAKAGQLTGSDADGDDLVFEITSQPLKGAIENLDSNEGTYVYRPGAGQLGADSFTFTVRDSQRSAPATISVMITEAPVVNRAPIAQPLSVTVVRNTAKQILLPAYDPDGDTLFYAFFDRSNFPTKGDPDWVNQTTGSMTYTPNNNALGADTLKFRVRDTSNVWSEPADVSITIVTTAPINTLPMASNGVLAVSYQTAKAGQLSASDSDGNPLTYSIVSQPGKGDIEGLNVAMGSYTYRPRSGQTGSDSFQFRVHDGTGFSGNATVSVTISSAPVASYTYHADIKPLMAKYCTSCHSSAIKTSGVSLDAYRQADYAGTFEGRWNRVLARMQARTMPPNPNTKASDAEVLIVQQWIAGGHQEGTVPSDPNPPDCGAGSTYEAAPARIWRLSHVQFDNSIRDLVNYDPNGRTDFAPDAAADTATLLKADRVLTEQYKVKAEAIAVQATANLTTLLGCATVTDNCVRTFISDFGRRIWRQPLSEDQKARLFTLYDKGRDETSVRVGVQMVLEALIQSPQFLYRYELGGTVVTADGVELTPYELAAELSYYFWDTTPDATLQALANSGAINNPAELQAQASRLLASERSNDTAVRFFSRLFKVDDLAAITKDSSLYPSFTGAMKTQMDTEFRTFVKDVVFQGDGRLSSLMTANYSYLNQALANHYGVPGVTGTGFRKVNWPNNGQRAGILTQSSVMSALSHEADSGPFARGVFVRARLLCNDLPAPPANVPPAPEPESGVTTRERYAMHSSSQACVGCHRLIDGIGFSFENYDPIGRYRTMDNGSPVDASGNALDSDIEGAYVGAVSLGQKLAQSEQFGNCVNTQYFRHSFGRREDVADSCEIASLQAKFKQSGSSVKSMISELVKTKAFRFRKR